MPLFSVTVPSVVVSTGASFTASSVTVTVSVSTLSPSVTWTPRSYAVVTNPSSFAAANDDGLVTTAYDLGVQVTDGDKVDTDTVTVTLEAVNDAPVLTTTDGTVTENSGNLTTEVASVGATDDDNAAADLSYSITSGNDAGYFTIDGATGAITLTAAGVAAANDDGLVTTAYNLGPDCMRS